MSHCSQNIIAKAAFRVLPCAVLAVHHNIYVYIVENVSTDLFSDTNNTVAVVRMRSMRPHVKSMKIRIPGGIRSFFERKELIAISKEIFSSVFLPPLVMLIT